MFKNHEKFYSANGKRQILIVDDEAINRELLGQILGGEYELLYAGDGGEALDMMLRHGEMLSMVLLDLMMPGMSGLEVLRAKRDEPAIQQIPVIVVTADQKSEVESLTLGASDFIPKPYPQPDVIRARVLRAIELAEDRQIILSTERDVLTGLYSREYFYRYAEQLDQYHREQPMDAIVIDINHFHMINERFGTAYGDAVLRRIGEKVRAMVLDDGGIVCRRESDTFMVYCPHGKDYRAILDGASEGLVGNDKPGSRIRLRMGVYENVDKSLDIERRFDRAKNAADAVRGTFSHAIGFYDDKLHKKELFDEQLIEDFHAAIEERQFEVWYQPKFDIRTSIPMLTSAEALVRWRHPALGLVSPGVFIPLFEANGLIEALDQYVWRATAAQIREWKERLGFCVPVSVNVSRVDMLDPGLFDTFSALLSQNNLEPRDMLLEITESAYTQDSDQIIQAVNRLREMGFQVEMDDFGTGYSSLNMISTLPIDALKLDMQFIRNAFDHRRDTRMLEVIIEIADYLSVPVIAEGVETQEQLNALKAMGCDIVQGYYFSKPVPAAEFESFILERRDMESALADARTPHGTEAEAHWQKAAAIRAAVSQALTADYFQIFYINIDTDRYLKLRPDDTAQEPEESEDFFTTGRALVLQNVSEDSREELNLALNKPFLLRMLAEKGSFTFDYRCTLDDRQSYIHMKASRMVDHDDPHIVIGLRNIDDVVKRQQAQAEAMQKAAEFASRDALTGVKSKRVFAEAELQWDARILTGSLATFAVAVFDLNNLHLINDSLGHAAGDSYICAASGLICSTFQHSPVYRLEGDRFAAVLTGSDYEYRAALRDRFRALNMQRSFPGEAVVACGMAEYAPGRDTRFEEVLARADADMRENKKQLKDKK